MAWTPPQPAKYIRLDLFPAQVDGIAKTVRVIVTDAHFYFFVDTPEGPAPEVWGELYDIEGRNTIGYTITADDDDFQTQYRVTRATGCGCGSRLRGFRPFPGVPVVGLS